MKKKYLKTIVLSLSLVVIFALAFSVSAMLCNHYTTASSASGYVTTTASIQANPNSSETLFSKVTATHRADPLTSYTGGNVSLNITLTAYKNSSVSSVYFDEGTFALNATSRVVNFRSQYPWGISFTDSDGVYKVKGEYEAYYSYADEYWYTPTIVMFPDEVGTISE